MIIERLKKTVSQHLLPGTPSTAFSNTVQFPKHHPSPRSHIDSHAQLPHEKSIDERHVRALRSAGAQAPTRRPSVRVDKRRVRRQSSEMRSQ
ncbi:hypothetical protein EVAR_66476_1 [Eumeta japonica]|uniref:Uncharacterized protein n=1 Tax=Eumeta variegata TaxID=151549 RepID=A0A4C1ZVP2_EUMVA|nr:hypothetical protein EVAR_66476_1 [Eumeta japonica]